ncbi:hypothetical protein [Streptomyces sp. NPDC052015]|uniref:hypothetical protein n=1 Tax=Streptomyces sp. NPDC052015 TaxID=3154755 RepID=UPI00342EB8B3
MEDCHTRDTGKPQEGLERIRRRITRWRIHEHLARGMAYGVGSGAVSLLLLWVQTR